MQRDDVGDGFMERVMRSSPSLSSASSGSSLSSRASPGKHRCMLGASPGPGPGPGPGFCGFDTGPGEPTAAPFAADPELGYSMRDDNYSTPMYVQYLHYHVNGSHVEGGWPSEGTPGTAPQPQPSPAGFAPVFPHPPPSGGGSSHAIQHAHPAFEISSPSKAGVKRRNAISSLR